jgi:hypothetical protein
MASVLMVIVILFFLCHSSRIIVNLYEALQVILNLHHIHWVKHGSYHTDKKENKIFLI